MYAFIILYITQHEDHQIRSDSIYVTRRSLLKERPILTANYHPCALIR